MTPDPSTILIFDWDDTLCPSTAIDLHSASTLSDLPPSEQLYFNSVAHQASLVLRSAAAHGTVLIITNSDSGWVEYSASRFLPSLLPTLQSDLVSTVSARTRYEGMYPGQPLCWKAAAFAHEVNERIGRNDGAGSEPNCGLEDRTLKEPTDQDSDTDPANVSLDECKADDEQGYDDETPLPQDDVEEGIAHIDATTATTLPNYPAGYVKSRRNSVVMEDVATTLLREPNPLSSSSPSSSDDDVSEDSSSDCENKPPTSPSRPPASQPAAGGAHCTATMNTVTPPGSKPGSPAHAKGQGGQQLRPLSCGPGPSAIISFGDSLEERTSTKIVASQLSSLPKSVKFVSRPPSARLILGQLRMVHRYMQGVVNAKESLDLEVGWEQAEEEGGHI